MIILAIIGAIFMTTIITVAIIGAIKTFTQIKNMKDDAEEI